MTEKEKNFLDAFKAVLIFGGFSDKEVKAKFDEAAVERMEEIGQTALSAVDPINDYEKPLFTAAFKMVANMLYNSLDDSEKGACEVFMKMCKTTLIRLPKVNEEGK